MRLPIIMGLGLIMAASVAVQAADVESGPQVGDKIGAYTTKKCNAVADGVKEGQRLCYT